MTGTALDLASFGLKVDDLCSRLIKKVALKVRWMMIDPRFLVMVHLGRFIAIREWAANRSAYTLSPIFGTSAILTREENDPSTEFMSVANKIQEFGYYEGLQLRPDILSEIIEFANSTRCYANRNPDLPFFIRDFAEIQEQVPTPLLKAGYFDLHETCEAFQKLRQDALLNNIASQYLGHDAVYMRGELAWDFPANTTLREDISNARVYHCDINDYKTIKFFFYLTDVGLRDGAHVYLKGTHRNRKLTHQWIGQAICNVPDKELVRLYGDDRIKVITGKAGYGFAGDPYCLHKGTVPTDDNRRLLMQLEFGITKYKTWYF